MIRRGVEKPQRRSGIEEDERQPVMARLAARLRCSNLDKLATLQKGNHLGEAYVKRGRRKALYKRERDSLEGPHEEAEIQRKTFIEDTCLEKEKVRSKVTPRKVGVGLKRRREPSRRSLAGG